MATKFWATFAPETPSLLYLWLITIEIQAKGKDRKWRIKPQGESGGARYHLAVL